MLKCLLVSFYCCTILQCVNAQQKKSPLFDFVKEKKQNAAQNTVTQLFFRSETLLSSSIDNVILIRQALQLDKIVSQKLFNQKTVDISLLIPAAGNKSYQLELSEQDISSNGLSLSTLSGTGNLKSAGLVNAVHYRGYVSGQPASLATMSIFENGEVMILFSNEEGNFNLGKIYNSDTYILYNSANMRSQLGFECGSSNLPVIGTNKQQEIATPQPQAAPSLLCKKVRIFWEADYKLYSNNFGSNLTNTANYLAGLFNQVSAMYQNEGILIELNDTYIWTSPDLYNTSTSANGLATLKTRYNGLGNNFNADLCILIDGAPTNNGGLAYILDNDFCNRAFAYGYTDIYATYNTVPTYSWDVEVLTHEMGHLMGSFHTQWCGWNTGAGNTCGAIDDCFAVEVSPVCTSCTAITSTTPSAPAGFMGTVMSYCYLRSGIGVNLSYGFGSLPQARIRNSINGAACPLLDNKWTGVVNNAWENGANWSCGSIPDINTDVTISNAVTNYPVVNSAAVCRKIKQQANSSVTVKTGFSLKVAGTPH